MNMAKRIRILAGPNGSGKTSIYKDLRDEFNWGVFVNADLIEQSLRKDGELNLSAYGVSHVSKNDFDKAFLNSAQAKKSKCTLDNVHLEDDVLAIKDSQYLDSYFSAFVASFIQSVLIEAGISFSMETVMSHPSKLEMMKFAKQKGYRVYLYYVSTLSPEINVGRVRTRVAEGGHDVEDDKIRSRYVRSLDQLFEAISLSDRAYVFDNSGKSYQWIAEYDAEEGALKVFCSQEWFAHYVLKKLEK